MTLIHSISFQTSPSTFVVAIPNPVAEVATLRPLPPNPCQSHPCGPNSICRPSGGRAECSCVSGAIGTAPDCRPECLISSDCPVSRNCVNRLCVDPCAGACAVNAQCRVVNHSPVCSCQQGFQGNGYSQCRPIPVVGKTGHPVRLIVHAHLTASPHSSGIKKT